jgi:hypothetical protein
MECRIFIGFREAVLISINPPARLASPGGFNPA